MIEALQGFPDNVVAFAAKGHVTRRDYEDVLIPRVKQALAKNPRLRCYYELGSGFSEIDVGAAWEDFMLGIEHLTRWERVAMVTDVHWIRFTANLCRFLFPGALRVFGTGEAAEARRWISAP